MKARRQAVILEVIDQEALHSQEELRRRLRGPFTVIWDRHRIHSKAKAVQAYLAEHPEVVAEDLPPYAPELNPVERLWLYLRQHHWSNRTLADIDALEEAAVAGWRAVCLKPEKVRSICRCEYAINGT